MADDRAPLGRVAYETETAWCKEKFESGDFTAWEDADGDLRELFMRIGSAVAARAVEDAGLRNDRRDAQLFALQAHLPAVLEALRFAEASEDVKVWAKRYKAALDALGGGEGHAAPEEPQP